MKLPIYSLLASLAAASAYECFTFNVSLTLPITSLPAAFPPFQSHYDSVAFLDAFTARNASTAPPFTAPVNLTETFRIHTLYCAPSWHSHPASIQILTHGLGFDHTYWNFGGPSSEYNYVRVATDAGYGVVLYDRVGNGLSSIVDPYNIQQAQIELAILVALTEKVRSGTLYHHIPKPKKVYHVGHSFGSSLTNAIAASAPSLSDGIALTGYAKTTLGAGGFAIASNFHLARENQPKRFGHLSTGSLTWGDELANQYSFLAWPYFDPKVLAKAEANKFPFALGEFITMPAISQNASSFTKPVLLISGALDQIFCESDCVGLLEQAAPLFPKAQPFQTYIQPATGHGMNLHYNASGFYSVIQDFFKAHA